MALNPLVNPFKNSKRAKDLLVQLLPPMVMTPYIAINSSITLDDLSASQSVIVASNLSTSSLREQFANMKFVILIVLARMPKIYHILLILPKIPKIIHTIVMFLMLTAW